MIWWSQSKRRTWAQTTIADHPVRYGMPSKRQGVFALLYLHDVDGRTLEEVPGATELFEQLPWPIICPQVGPTWWLDLQWLRESLVPWIHSTFQTPHRGIALLGIGMGGQGALQLGFAHGDQFPVVVSMQAAIAFEQLYGQGTVLDQCFTSPEHARQYTAGMMVNPRLTSKALALIAHPNDALWFRGNDRLHEKLVAMGVEHHSHLTGDGSPQWWREQFRWASQYIQQAMQAESRRLL
jgi:hypothetical protein